MTDETTVANTEGEVAAPAENGQASAEDTVAKAAAQEPTGAEPAAQGDWRDSITDEKVRKFAGQFASPAEAAKAALEFRQKLSNTIRKPGEDATEEEIEKFREQIGIPKDVSGYEIQVPEDLPGEYSLAEDEGLQDFVVKMHDAGAPKEVVKAATDWYYNAIMEHSKQEAAMLATSIEKASSELRKEWGGEFDANVEGARRAFKQFGGEQMEKALSEATYEGVAIGNHPAFIKAFASIWKRIGEDGFKATMTDEEKASTEDKLKELTRQAHDATARGDSRKAAQLFKQRSELSKQFYGQ